jgi:hypothetical protein
MAGSSWRATSRMWYLRPGAKGLKSAQKTVDQAPCQKPERISSKLRLWQGVRQLDMGYRWGEPARPAVPRRQTPLWFRL